MKQAAQEALADRIRSARVGIGLSQREMAAELERRGLAAASYASYRRYESGQKSPSVEILRGIAEVAGSSIPELLGADRGRLERLPFPHEVPSDGLQILGHLEAELVRRDQQAAGHGVQKAFETVEARVERLRDEGRIGDAGYAYWLALRRGATLAGGYAPQEPIPEAADFGERSRRSAD